MNALVVLSSQSLSMAPSIPADALRFFYDMRSQEDCGITHLATAELGSVCTAVTSVLDGSALDASHDGKTSQDSSDRAAGSRL
jgi:hypothetical protein